MHHINGIQDDSEPEVELCDALCRIIDDHMPSITVDVAVCAVGLLADRLVETVRQDEGDCVADDLAKAFLFVVAGQLGFHVSFLEEL